MKIEPTWTIEYTKFGAMYREGDTVHNLGHDPFVANNFIITDCNNPLTHPPAGCHNNSIAREEPNDSRFPL